MKIDSNCGKTVICFGEIMLRLAPKGFLRFEQANEFEVVYGGSEANVAVSLANFNMNSGFVTKLPNNPIGEAAINELRKFGVSTNEIHRGGERIGVYYIEKGASQRSSKVVYDRKHSSFSEISQYEFEWDCIFENASWFHFTGITPAISKNASAVTIEACKSAKKNGIRISCDLNYRENLWTTDEAKRTMSEIMKYVDICIINEEHARRIFEIKVTDDNMSRVDKCREVAIKLKEKFKFTDVAITMRAGVSASDNSWSAMLYDGFEFYFSKEYAIRIVDRVGGGDAFGAGLIYGVLNNYDKQETIDFAGAASCLKHSIEGDFNLCNVEEVRTLMLGDGSGRIQR